MCVCVSRWLVGLMLLSLRTLHSPNMSISVIMSRRFRYFELVHQSTLDSVWVCVRAVHVYIFSLFADVK